MYEVEQKFPVADLAALEEKLVSLGAATGDPVRQLDRYFAHPSRDFSVTDEALRIRRIGQHNWVTYKGPKIDTTTKTRREIELPLPKGDAGAAGFADLLSALGFTFVADVRKTRRHANLTRRGRPIEIALDEVDDLGTFVELELAAGEADLDDARRALAELAAELGLKNSERRSYLELLLER